MGAARFAQLPALAGLILIAGSAAALAQAPPTPSTPDGAALFRTQCGTCHTLDPAGPTRQGPHLQGVVGRGAGTVQGFRYSPNLANAGFAWDEAKLDAYLTNPQAVVKGGVMPYRQSKPEIRTAIIEYLKEQQGRG